MTRSQRAIALLRKLRPLIAPEWAPEIDAVIAMPEDEGEKADREVAEMVEEALRMSGGTL
jgi:hypothetical protein